MRNTFLLICLCPCFVFGQSTNDSISKTEFRFSYTIDSLIDISLDIAELNWYDSTIVNFLTITHFDIKYDLKHSNLWNSKKYQNLDGPIAVVNDSCLIYPILTKGNTSYFLLDDFKHLTDSIIYLSINVSVGEYDMNQALTFSEYPTIELNELTTLISLIEANPNAILATNEWYASWVQNNPGYRDQRIRNNTKQCK